MAFNDGAAPGGPMLPGAPPAMPAPPSPPPMLHDVECIRSKNAANVKIEPVPPEEFGISRTARSLRDCDYAFHKVLITRAKLIAQGYDETQVNTLTPYIAMTNIEEIQRDTVNEYQTAGDEANKWAQKVEVTEHYVRMDYEGNGKPCLYQVTTGGSQGDILEKDGETDIAPIDGIPFAAMTPVIITHRFFGRSIADLVMDIQRIKTALLRAILDNAYLSVNPRVEVPEAACGTDTLDDLLVSRPGGIVRTKGNGGMLQWQTVPSIAQQTFPVVEYMDATREFRTGVTRQGQGIDADALQNQSATAVNQIFTVAQARIKLIARIFAETGIRDLFSLVHETIRKHGEQAATVQLRHQWVTVDPREWKKRDHMTVHVGLGTGTKQAQLGAMQLIAGAQEKLIPLGMVSKKNAYNTATQFVQLAGHKSADQFFIDPSQPPNPQDPASAPIPPPPDPKAAQAQQQAQLEQQKAQHQAILDKQKADNDLQHQIAKNGAELELAKQKAALEAQLAITKANIDAEERRQQMRHQSELHAVNLTHLQQTHLANLENMKNKASMAPNGKGT